MDILHAVRDLGYSYSYIKDFSKIVRPIRLSADVLINNVMYVV